MLNILDLSLPTRNEKLPSSFGTHGNPICDQMVQHLSLFICKNLGLIEYVKAREVYIHYVGKLYQYFIKFSPSLRNLMLVTIMASFYTLSVSDVVKCERPSRVAI